jgi:hypothetical protein
MSNVLSKEKKQQDIALGKVGWPLRRIEQATGVRRETASVPESGGSDTAAALLGKAEPDKTGRPRYLRSAPRTQRRNGPECAGPASKG